MIATSWLSLKRDLQFSVVTSPKIWSLIPDFCALQGGADPAGGKEGKLRFMYKNGGVIIYQNTPAAMSVEFEKPTEGVPHLHVLLQPREGKC